MSKEPKQVIVVRGDLNMNPGKLSAQVAHASMKVITDMMQFSIENEGSVHKIVTEIGGTIDKWLFGVFTKVVVKCKDEKELLLVYKKAKESNIPTTLIQDVGLTVFKKPTFTCAGIGPEDSVKIDKVTKYLPLYK